MEITGKVIAVLPKVTGTGAHGAWARQTVVIEYMNGEYPANLALENSNKAEEFGRLQVGDTITAKFSVSSREYQGRWYTSTKCFAWDIVGSGQQAPAVAPTPTVAAPAPAAESVAPSDAKDDLPF